MKSKRPGSLAIFDLDYTLLEGDSETMWCQFLCDRKLVGLEFLLRIREYYHAYEQGDLDIREYETFLLSPILSRPMPELMLLRERFLYRVQKAFRPAMLNRVRRFRALGFSLLLITATNSFLAEPIARILQFPHLICTQLRKIAGKPVAEVEGVPAFQEGKRHRLEEWLAREERPLAGSWGYGDSHNDLPFLELVDHPVAVSPDPILREYAKAHAWTILEG